MNNNLVIIRKNANLLAEDAQNLADKLQDIVIESTTQTAGVDPFIYAITIFILACFVGYYVVWRVTPALHTPLMAVTNAISGIIIVGAIIAVGPEDFDFPQFTGFIAVMLAAINIFGGFIVTHRMLDMFRKK
jgi:NAD(P) transhydrogenase subunit alpha